MNLYTVTEHADSKDPDKITKSLYRGFELKKANEIYKANQPRNAGSAKGTNLIRIYSRPYDPEEANRALF